MSTEKLIVQLDADNSKLNKGLDESSGKLGKLDDSTKKTDTSFKSLSKAGGAVGAALKVVGVASVAAASAITAIAVASAKSVKEMDLLSSQAKMSIEDFQAFTYATEQYNISAEQAADISKDLADKLGEYSTAGTGAFQDFIDVMGLTKEEGKALSKEFQDMSSDQVIGEMVKRMEDAGASANQMTFALESMGNDLSRLIPLFSDNSKELDKLVSSFNAANASMAITASQAQDLKELSASFDLLTASVGNATTSISATLAPVLTDFFNDAISIIPEAEQAIVNFLNRFIEVEHMNSIEDVNKQFEAQTEIMQNNLWAQEQLEAGIIVTGKAQDAQIKALEEYNAAQERSEELIFRRIELEKELEESLLKDASSVTGGDSSSSTGTSGAVDEIQALEDRFKTEQELLTEKLERELEIAAGNKELMLQLENEYIENLIEIEDARDEAQAERRQKELDDHQKLLDDKLKADQDAAKSKEKTDAELLKLDTKKQKEERRMQDATFAAAEALGTALFEDNKAVRSGLVIADTAMAISRQFADLPYPAALATSATIAANGAIQLAAINSSSKGGGGTSATSPAATSVTESEDVTGQVEVNESVVGGSNVSNTITITAEDGDELALAFASVMNKKLGNGEI